HDIDIGVVPQETMVHVKGAVLVAPIRSDGVDAEGIACMVEAYVQDPGAPAPGGIRVFADGPPCASAACECPPVGAMVTTLDAMTTIGDVFDLVGESELFVLDGGALLEHGIFVDRATKTASGAPPAPIVITDPTPFALNGAGFQAQEGMLVTIRPA